MRKLSILLMILIASAPATAKEEPSFPGVDGEMALQSLDAELTRLDTDTVLLVPSEAVDEFPVWSPDGSRLAANVMGVWYTVDLNRVALAEATWRGSLLVGVLNSEESVVEAPEAAAWKAVANAAPRVINVGNGTQIELRQDGMSTAFVIETPGSAPKTLWKSDLENCHSLSLSPDQRLVAFICELNGVIVYRLSAGDEAGGA